MDSRDYSKEFHKLFDPLSRKHGWHRLFEQFVEIAALTIHQHPYQFGMVEKDEDYERIEEAYLAAIAAFEKEEQTIIAQLFAISMMALTDLQEDFLGQLYMEMEIANKHVGQFFTPKHVSRMMAEMQMFGIEERIKEKGFITLSEPACGAGVMVIEAGNVLRAQGFDPGNAMLFQAVDISRICFNMAYFQFSVLGLSGEVVHGDTIAFQQYEVRETPRWKVARKRDGLPAFPKPEIPVLPPAPIPAPKAKPQNQLIFDF